MKPHNIQPRRRYIYVKYKFVKNKKKMMLKIYNLNLFLTKNTFINRKKRIYLELFSKFKLKVKMEKKKQIKSF